MAPSWRPYCGCPRRGGRPRPRTGSRAPCQHTWQVVIGGRVAKTTPMETVYLGAYRI